MGKMADRCYLQKRVLNRSKVGPATSQEPRCTQHTSPDVIHFCRGQQCGRCELRLTR